MLDSHRNNSSLETLGTLEIAVTACLRRWAVGDRAVHVGGSLKTDDEIFESHTRPQQHGFVVLLVIVAPPPCMWPTQSRDFVCQVSYGNQESEWQESTG